MPFWNSAGPKVNGGVIEAIKRGKDPSLFVVLFEDSAAILGLLIAFFGIFLGQITGNPYFDGIASIMIGLLLGGTAVWLAYETKGLLIGESANQEVIQGIRTCANGFPIVEHVNEVLTMHMGPDFLLVNISIDFANTTTAEKVEQTISKIDRQLKNKYPVIKRIFIEAEAKPERIVH